MIVDTKKQNTKKEVSNAQRLEKNKGNYTMIAFRLSVEQMNSLKQEAIKEKRSISNLIKSKLF